jgi:DNA-directed RNA polymerase subunit RPC12/RpoP
LGLAIFIRERQVSSLRCLGPECGRPFQLNQFSTKFSLSAERGRITCPHCGRASVGDANSIFLTHALSVAEEAEFNVNHPPASSSDGR